MLDKREFYIDGRWMGPAEPRDLEVIDPATEEPCAVISLGGQRDTDAAVFAATAAFPAWAALSPEKRAAYCAAILEQYRKRKDEMAEAIRAEMGAPIKLARESQAPSLAWHLSNFLDAVDQIDWIKPLGDHAPNDRIAMEPIGVVGLITPWNWPMNQVTLKVIPALLAGCTVVLKPSEEAPLSSILFAEFVHDAGLPAGVFNLVNGDGAGVGTQLSTHPDVSMISFTGSTRAGIAISKAAADTLKRVTLELGGKGANVIFADAGPKAVKQGVLHCMQNSGQSCNAPTRMLVEESIYDQTVAEAAEIAQGITVGPTTQDGRHIGPVVNKSQWDKIQAMIERGIAEGARLVAGGPGLPEGVNRGYYVRPTVFADVSNDMDIAQQEIFGPVLSIIPFKDEADAVRIANDTAYGLTNYVQTEDGARRNRMALALKSGMVEMNGTSRAAGSPFGGMKMSGRAREGGVWGIEEFLEVKAISGWSND
ncbi:aldehyde dehydrogenase family protein [Loktanella sp. SALINAS62]|uniref:aldehyde dehydrogenase family protein n=1 Tax=Loktanella sp. SALINAS62 TaxID=2706124 RepID=UPI001B8DA641|nr:aldehyde dehydrogenase family protein [Loktanella sp. SALINAS62]MBS1302342.1 aldehyde dehydrogenase family protein [Loktanella sp. SALINAS62]